MVAFCSSYLEVTVQKGRQCRAIIADWPCRAHMGPAERRALADYLSAANEDSSTAAHLIFTNITAGWLGGTPSPVCLQQCGICSLCG